MVILSVSGDPADTMEMIADYKASHGLSFPMGLAGDALGFLKVSAFPTTVFIAKDGKVGFIKVGAFTSGKDFEDKVGTFLSDPYQSFQRHILAYKNFLSLHVSKRVKTLSFQKN